MPPNRKTKHAKSPMASASCPVRELSSPRDVQSASWQSASWRIRELTSNHGNPRTGVATRDDCTSRSGRSYVEIHFVACTPAERRPPSKVRARRRNLIQSRGVAIVRQDGAFQAVLADRSPSRAGRCGTPAVCARTVSSFPAQGHRTPSDGRTS